MELQELYSLIELQPEITQKLEETGKIIDFEEADIYLRQLLDIKTAAQSYQSLKVYLNEDTDHLKMLYCQLECARRAFENYEKKQISKAVYADTMKCFPRFLEECNRKNGRMFFDRGWWTYRQISLNLFRIGALEYQFREQDGECVIAIHIPSDADFSKETVDASLNQAKLFFQTHYPEYEYHKYICNSWLLSPALTPLLSENSNILSFQKRFHMIREDKTDQEFIEWLFQVPVDTDYQQLPAQTHLQKQVKKLLLAGGAVGSACGIMKAR